MVLWDAVVGGLLNKVAPAVAGYYQKKLELKHQIKLTKLEGKQKIEQARANRKARLQEMDHVWEQAMIANAGWKDEWVLVLLSIPLVMSFIPYLAPFVGEGFAVLETTPDWYQWLVLLIFPAIYGIRVWRRKITDAEA